LRSFNGYHFIVTTPKVQEVCDYSEEMDFWKYEVEPETLGEYTGQKDIHGKEIFTGDVVESTGTHMRGTVIFENGRYGLLVKSDSYFLSLYRLFIVGNIYDEPELKKTETTANLKEAFKSRS
jgi:hypothetical protein